MAQVPEGTQAVFTKQPSTPILQPDRELADLGGFAWTSTGIIVATNKNPDSQLIDFFN